MNLHPAAPSRAPRKLRLLAACLAAGAGVAPLAGADAPAAKPYTLYMGADLAIERDGRLWPVQGVERNSFMIETGGKRVPVREADLKLKIDSALKLTTAYATLAGLKAERAYTPAHDPRHHVGDAMAVAADASSNVDLAVAGLNNMQVINGREQVLIANWDSRLGPAPTPSYSSNDFANAASNLSRDLSAQGAEIGSTPDAINREQLELARGAYDAFSLSFEISARRSLADPYLVALVRYREKADDPKTGRLLVYAQVLPPLDAKPQAVRLFRGGFPPGYALEGCQIHVYDHGTEVATSAAPKQMAMTTDEAFQYTLIDYEVRNRDQTLPPAPDKTFWPRDLGERLPAKKLDRSLYVKVGKDGRVAGFYADAECRRPVQDADLEAVRPDLHFFPAMEKGRAVDGIVAFNLGRRVD